LSHFKSGSPSRLFNRRAEVGRQKWFGGRALADGRRFSILAIVDDFTRECLALVADMSLPGLRVARELYAHRCRPATIVLDNGTEFTNTMMHASNGITSRLENRNKMHSSSGSMAGCGTNASTRCASRPLPITRVVTGKLTGRLQHSKTAWRPW
jgi:hypothetical protein